MRAWDLFLLFHAAAVVLDATERWQRPAIAWAVSVGALALLFLPARWRRFADVAWLAGTALSLGVLAPDLANHRNLTLYVDALLLVAWAGTSLRGRRWARLEDGRVLALASPALRGSVAVVYLFAGFHKLNRDFLFEPSVSCAGGFVEVFSRLWTGQVLALPSAWITPMAVAVVVWELGLSVALPLSSPHGRLRQAALIGAWTLHAVLALAVFFDFSALMFALLWAFVPRGLLDDPLIVRRARLGVIVIVAAGLLSGIAHLAFEAPVPAMVRAVHALQGLLIIAMLVGCAVPVLRRWQEAPDVEPAAVPVPRTARWLLGAPLLLALFASSNYFGLRTAGTFSMFSNLRTEGGRSNHLLVPAEHRFVFGQRQRDLVWIEALDPRARMLPDSQPIDGLGIPRVELARHLSRWRSEGLGPVRATVRDAAGVRHEVADIAAAEALTGSLVASDWEKRLLDFRPVQPDTRGPNACRW